MDIGTILLVAAVASQPVAAGAVPFVGTVHDLDYLAAKGHTQIIAVGNGPSVNQLICVTNSPLLQAMLESSLRDSREVEIGCSAGATPSVSYVLLLVKNGCSTPECVAQIRCTAKECTSQRVAPPQEAHTGDTRALGVLLNSVSRSLPAEYLNVDPKRIITRVKVNVP